MSKDNPSTPPLQGKANAPREFWITNPAINQDFGNHKQSVRMCIETEDKNFRITGESIHVIEMSAYTKLKSERDAAVEALKYYASEDTWIKKEFKVNGEFSQWWDRLPNDKSIVPYKIGDATGNFNVLGAKARAVLASLSDFDKGEGT